MEAKTRRRRTLSSAYSSGFALRRSRQGATLAPRIWKRVGVRSVLQAGAALVPLGALVFVFLRSDTSAVVAGVGSAIRAAPRRARTHARQTQLGRETALQPDRNHRDGFCADPRPDDARGLVRFQCSKAIVGEERSPRRFQSDLQRKHSLRH